MSRWKDSFEKHPLHATLNEIHDCLKVTRNRTNKNEVTERRRALKVIVALQDAIKNLDPELINTSQLDNLNNQLSHQNFLPQVRAYKQSGGLKNLTLANNHLTSFTAAIANLNAHSIRGKKFAPVKNLETLVDDFADQMVLRTEELEEKNSELEKLIIEQKNETKELSASVDAKKQETDAFISDWQKQFSDAQNKRSSQFNEWMRDTAKEAQQTQTELFKQTNATISTDTASFKNNISEVLKEVETKRSQILDLYGLVSGDTMAADFVKNANKEQDQANFWRWTAIAFIVATVCWLGLAIGTEIGINETGKFIWSKLVMAASITGVLLYGAGYSAQQSTKHRKNEIYNRRYALKVNAIEPFLSSMPDEQKNELKKELSSQLFKLEDGEEEGGDHFSEHAIGVVGKVITDAIKAAKN